MRRREGALDLASIKPMPEINTHTVPWGDTAGTLSNHGKDKVRLLVAGGM